MINHLKAAFGFGQRDNAPDPNFSTREAGYLLTRADGSSTIDEETRSVEFVLSTERAVPVWDYRNWRPIDEVLLSDAVRFAGGEPLLDSHNRYSVEFIRGSVHDIRKEAGQVVGRVHFSKADEASRVAWEKVREGHINAGSVGYIVKKAIEIPAGEKRMVAGREWVAGQSPLRVVTEWQLREFSLVPVGADDMAKMRSAYQPTNGGAGGVRKKETPMKFTEQAIRVLETFGLRVGADEATATAFYEQLSAERQDVVNAFAAPAPTPEPTRTAPAPLAGPSAEEVQRQVQEAIAAERAADRLRVDTIRAEGAAYNIPPTVVDACVREGKTIDQARAVFLQSTQNSRGEAVHGGVHIGSTSNDLSRDVLAMALVRRGVKSNEEMQRAWNRGILVRQGEVMADEAFKRACGDAEKFSGMSAMTLCREALRIEAESGLPGAIRNLPVSDQQIAKRAFSTATLSSVLSNTLGTRLQDVFEEKQGYATTLCRPYDVPNFKEQEIFAMGKVATLSRRARGNPAEHITTDDKSEKYRVSSYAGKYQWTWEDAIDDNMRALERIPLEAGNAAARLVDELFAAYVLSNPLMDDGYALFSTEHGNLGTTGTALDAEALELAYTAFSEQFQLTAEGTSVPINVLAQYLYLPTKLKMAADTIIDSPSRIIASASGGIANPMEGKLKTLADVRINAAGLINPLTKERVSGSDTAYYLFADPGEFPTFELGFLAGTNRAPTMDTEALPAGEYGYVFAVQHTAGIVALDHRGVRKNTGQA